MKKNFLIFTAFIFVIALVVGYFFVFKKNNAKAERFILKSGNLYSISDILGEKQLTTNGDIEVLFEQKKGKILFGKKWQNETIDSERAGGTTLWIMDENGRNASSISDDLVIDAFLNNQSSKIFYNTRNLDLYAVDADGAHKIKLAEKIIRPQLSNNEQFLVYQKLNSDWQIGDYFDKALGIAILNLNTAEERLATNNWEDFNPTWAPNGEKILFFSRSSEGLASHFIMKSDGSERKQITNIGERFVSDKTVDIPSEKPIWSSDGKYLVYESDKEIWINEFDAKLENIINAKQIAFGKNPQWLIDGKSITILTGNNSQNDSLLTIDINGKILK